MKQDFCRKVALWAVRCSTLFGYTYGDDNWKDKLTAFNGQTITYDTIGNPLQYRDGMSFTWAYGRRVHTLNTTAHAAQFNYNADGYRSQKILTDKSTNTATTHYYDYNGNSLICERWGNNVMWFVYDATGAPLGLIYNGTPYYYVTNLQGDITGLTNAVGTLIAQYTYDPWGKPLTVTDANGTDISANATHIANINPLRYRGYYYDVESGLYYLLSRYYDPVTQRFINADGQIDITLLLGGNLYTYCLNNPIMYEDTNGLEPSYSLDTNDDGIDDCFVYEYQYTITVQLRTRTREVKRTGKVYIYTDYAIESFLAMETPIGFYQNADAMVLDLTTSSNATMLLRQGQKIDKNHYWQIIEKMMEYDSDFSTSWERTKSSLFTEWISHAYFYFFSETAKNIDFDNEEEGKEFLYYAGKAAHRALTNLWYELSGT